jgi:acetylglutamate kinase
MLNISELSPYSGLLGLDSSKFTQLKNKTIVVKYGGAALEHQELRSPVIGDIAFLQHFGAYVVIVHGGSRQLDSRMRELGLQVKSTDGLRYTCSETIEEARTIFGGINAEIVGLLRDIGAPAVGLLGEENGLIKAELKSFETYGYVGGVKSIDVEKLRSIMGQGEIPVLTVLGRSDDGQILNINADDVARAVASSLCADKLVFITDVEGILQNPKDPSSLLTMTDEEGIESLLREHIISKGMIRKVKACLEAIRNDATVVHILSARQPLALITEIIGESHYGTKVVRKKSQVPVDG